MHSCKIWLSLTNWFQSRSIGDMDMDNIRQVIGNSLHNYISMTKGDAMFPYKIKTYSCNIMANIFAFHYCVQ
jgi:hypothetical protein